MENNDKERFGKLLVTTAELFEKELSPPVINLYFTALKGYAIDQIENALAKTITLCKFFPKPVEIIEFATGGQGKIEDVAQIQADIVVNTIRKIGTYRSVKFKDTITNAVVLNCFGGWIKICSELLEQNEQWFRKDFVKYYQAYSRQNIRSNEVLTGYINAENESRGFISHMLEPVLIYDFDVDNLKLIEE